jgi:hypothetical protein
MRPTQRRRGSAIWALAAVALVGSACSGSSGTDEPSAEPTASAGDAAPPSATIVWDDFAGDSADLDDQRLDWRSAQGRWSVDSGALVLRDAPEAFPSLAVTDVGGPDGTVSVTMPEITDGTGIVFRYRDQSNYWSLVAVPGFATWNLSKVVNNERILVGNTELAPTTAFTSVGVRLDGPMIAVTVDGRVRLEVTDGFLADETTAGVIAEQTGSVQGRWDDFYAIGIAPDTPPADEPASQSTPDERPTPASSSTATPEPTTAAEPSPTTAPEPTTTIEPIPIPTPTPEPAE